MVPAWYAGVSLTPAFFMKHLTLLFLILFSAGGASATDAQSIKPTPKGRLEKKFHKALEMGDEAAIKKVIRKKLRRYNIPVIAGLGFYRSENATAKLVDWLSVQPGLSKVVADTCGTHIAIWPGWSDFVLISDKSTGYAQYGLSIQHGRSRRLFCLSRIDYRSILLRLQRDDGRMLQSFERSCEVEKENDRRIAIDSKVRISADAGPLSYQSLDVEAPGFAQSEKNVLRVKIKVENTSIDTLFLLWPIRQNTGRRLIRAKLLEPTYRLRYAETDSLNLLINSPLQGPDTLMLAPGESYEQYHSLNDLLLGDGAVQASHLREPISPGKYRVRFVYQPFAAGADGGKCWKPSLDSTEFGINYMWQRPELGTADTFSVKAEVLQGVTRAKTQFGLSVEVISLVRVTESSRPDLCAVGDTLAWKLKSNAAALAGMPVDRSPFQKPGNLIMLELDGNLAKEVLETPWRGIRLFALNRGMRSVRRVQ